MMDLIDAVIDRSADILERVGAEVDQISHSIFEPEEGVKEPAYKDVLKALGRKGDLTPRCARPGLDRPPASFSDQRS